MEEFKYQENNGVVEVYVESSDGFEWICDCGDSNKHISWANAIIICNALNKTLSLSK